MLFLRPDRPPGAPGKGRVYTSSPSVTTSGYLFLPKCPSLDNQLQAHLAAGPDEVFRRCSEGLGRPGAWGIQFPAFSPFAASAESSWWKVPLPGG